jgi:hypothetical protein
METEARVTACHYEFARMNTFAFGIAKNTDKFTISFTYYAHGRAYSDNFTSPVARAQGETFSVSYNALTRISFLNDNPESSDRLNRQCL